MRMVRNAIGREVPESVEGKTLIPYKGAFAHAPQGTIHGPRLKMMRSGDKRAESIEEAIRRVGLKDGQTISFHHHLRDGDAVVNMVMQAIANMGIRNIVLAPTAFFPVHDPLVKLMEEGVIQHIEGSMNGPIGLACTYGRMKRVAVLRSHGGRVRAIEAGDLKIDVAFVAAPCADRAGNANGRYGKSACGPLGYLEADVRHAERVVIVTDNIQPYPVTPAVISQTRVDCVVEVPSIGDPAKIVSSTTKITAETDKLGMAEMAARVVEALGIIKPEFAFQAGAGGTSLAFTKYMGEILAERKVVGSFGMGGGTKFLVDILRNGGIRKIMEGQCFDVPSIEDMRDNPLDHVEMTPYEYANIHSCGGFVDDLDAVVLGATEVDVHFNANVNTHADGKLLHGIGGHADTAAGARCSIITVPTARKTNPTIVDDVVTVTTPGETVDIIVSEAGVAVNPLRRDLIKKLEGNKDIPLKTIEELRDIGYAKAGRKPEKPETTDKVVALIEYRDGTIIDVVRGLPEK